MKRNVLVLMIVGVCVVGTQGFADLLDQEATLWTTNWVVSDPAGGRDGAAQSFVPDLPTLTAVAMYVNDADASVQNAVITVDIFAAGTDPAGNGPTGPLLGTASRPVADIAGIGNLVWERFEFGAGIAVTPGSKYCFLVTLDDPEDDTGWLRFRGNAQGDSYPDGAYYIREGGPWMWHDGVTTRDFAFQTHGLPEPATMLLLGMGSLSLLRRKNS